jgi:hypothetical protein
MSIEEAIKKAVDDAVAPLQRQLDQLLAAIVIQQKDACEMAGVSEETARNKAKRGEIEILQRDGSRLNYITLKSAGELKPRRKQK